MPVHRGSSSLSLAGLPLMNVRRFLHKHLSSLVGGAIFAASLFWPTCPAFTPHLLEGMPVCQGSLHGQGVSTKSFGEGKEDLLSRKGEEPWTEPRKWVPSLRQTLPRAILPRRSMHPRALRPSRCSVEHHCQCHCPKLRVAPGHWKHGSFQSRCAASTKTPQMSNT